MRKSRRQNLSGTIALLFIAAAAAVFGFSLLTNLGAARTLPGGSTWGGVPVGGLTVEEAAARVESGDVIVVFSNGGFDNIHRRLIEEWKHR